MTDIDYSKAKCAEMQNPWEVFFPENGDIQAKVTYAKAICNLCPVALACFTQAMERTGEQYGIWGGTTGYERVQMRDNPKLVQVHIKTLASRAI